MAALTRAQAFREINRLLALMKLTPVTDTGKLTLAQLTKKIADLKTAVAAGAGQKIIDPPPKPKLVPTAQTTNKQGANLNQGAVIPNNPVWPPVTGPTALQATATGGSSTAKPTRASLTRKINELRAKLKLAPITDGGKLTIADMQREIVKLQYGIDHPAQPPKSSGGAAAGGTGANVVGDPTKTKSDLVKQINALLGGNSGLDPNTMNRTQLTNTITALQQQQAAGGIGGAGGAAGGDTIAGVPRKTFLIAGGVLIAIALVVALKKKGH